MNENTSPFDGNHSPTGFSGRTVTSVRAEMAQRGRNESALVSTSPGTYSRSDPPVSREVLAYQAQREGRAVAAQFYDHSTAAALASGGVHSDYNPAGYLAAHGFRATNAQGEEVAITPRQARGLVGQYMDMLNRGTTESISFRDDSLPPARATVFLRRR
jgi:hypothetical protein